jgi:hypothetical protein
LNISSKQNLEKNNMKMTLSFTRWLALAALPVFNLQLPTAFAQTTTLVTVVLKSDASTLATALGPGEPSSSLFNLLDSGNISNLIFQAADVGAFGTYTPVPGSAPAGTQVINIPPDDGENGFFKVSFVLPAGFQAVSLAGAANVDDYGRAFLNGNPISPSMSSSGSIAEYGDTPFSTTNAAFFQAGTNDLVIADANTGGGPSGAAFYATVTYHTATVLTAPRGLGNGQFQFSFNTLAGTNYTIQYSTTLTNWIPLLAFRGSGGPETITDPNATNRSRFYRVLRQ